MLRAERHGDVVVWTVDRPQARNALDFATLRAIAEAAREAASDRQLRAAVLTGAGAAFVSGGDLRELRDRHSAEDAEELSDAGYAATEALTEVPFPVIAALPGPAIGGGAELALACDMRIADMRARISFKQVRMGVTTSWGSVPRLTALVGSGVAARLLYTAHELTAEGAKVVGLVDEVTENDQAVPTAIAWASEIALGSPTAIAAMKRLVRETTAGAPAVRSLERRVFAQTWSGPDHRDAVEAFFERRPARWAPRS